MVALEELRLTYDVLSALMESARMETRGPTWHVLAASRAVVAAHIRRATAEAGFPMDWSLDKSET
jgi:hypothetical protein